MWQEFGEGWEGELRSLPLAPPLLSSLSLSQAEFWEQTASLGQADEGNESLAPLPPTPLDMHRGLHTGRSVCIQEVPSSYNYPQLANKVCRVAGSPART